MRWISEQISGDCLDVRGLSFRFPHRASSHLVEESVSVTRGAEANPDPGHERHERIGESFWVALLAAEGFHQNGKSLPRVPFPDWDIPTPERSKRRYQVCLRSQDHDLILRAYDCVDRSTVLP
jgi:hypothetical protein